MVHICKPMADIEADFLAVVTNPNEKSSRVAARDNALAELRGSYGISRDAGLVILMNWVSAQMKRDIQYEVVRTAAASFV